ncbi:PREDICTED: probable LRR receptor-like serine/threonine-protein kinase At1g56140 isoform X2 [Camelina sativa]|uniref:non-specific serine/threonine protein kinase n=1 Tax=Camelina sativa TaxID=90675 RepID=A0ABM0YI79_CAMSA|nr:PREDICTED: probable LRR receptor-like serine/threonine-protein kinase At1g56140 isoform X1 [Camelina sativa]XP_010501247.1 PREDICTED: probable LRR receptor-like serine/threonine-protein kinase At1g56140 isoform X2 [Camelina sativa]
MLRLRMSPCLFLTVLFLCNFGSVLVVRAQNRTGATTHPDEARALNSIFAAWRIRAPREWNISGELCSGAAIDDTVLDNNPAYNPLIKCDCSFENSRICRITNIKVFAREVVGPIPEELWTLKYLTNLNLGQNVLTGSLPPAIGNLTRMQWMTFGINALSGPVPKEIGLLTDLRLLSISSNNFSGSIPDEIGNCAKLQQIFIDSSGLSGRIPLSFANLVDLEQAWLADLEVTGQIPDFIGKWTKLTTLRILGTGLSGPIPSSFSNLTYLTELRLGDISNGSSSLEFIKDMKSLSILVLRNNNLTGTIPSTIGGYSSLQQVDLSFNKLHGPIPASLFNLSGLTHLFLGNNTLNGSLPTQKSQSLSYIDVSYNDLSGILPSWVSLPNLKLNLIANNFTLEDDNRVLSGLNCLQKNFPCNRGKGVYSDFSINCGGPEIRSTNGALFEREDEELGPASFAISAGQRWAASSVGLFAGSSSNIYKATSQSQFVNTLDSELFQSARLSASSLRYYGLGLENGGYTVTLQFAEIQILGSTSNTWKGLGRRRFDIYVQGRLVEKDFDVRKTAGDSTVRAIQKVYKANVSENHLEIHLFWAGKGTCCIPIQGAYGPLISAVSATPDFTPTVGNRPPSRGQNTTGIIVGVIVGVGLLSIFAGVAIFIIRKRRKRYTDDEEILSMDVKPFAFTYSELKSATQDFDSSNKLGEGGFGPVYKGKLNDGREVAVKLLSVGSRQGKGQFVAEIVAISAVQHRNLVKLYGCCYEGDHRLLVYEYLPNGSLDQALFGDKTLHLDWSTRYEICLGVARGLVYLHEEARIRIVHRDVKASNILLDSKLVPKVSDFGLAKLYDDKKTHISTRVAGTIGYLAPEYAMRGHLTEKIDVYAFGVVALELVSGRPNSDENLEDEKRYLLEWAWNLHEKSREVELIDHELTEFNMEEVKRMIGIALLCTQTSHALRPPMSRVVAMLSGDVEVSDVTSKPGYLTDWGFDDTTSSSLSGFQTKDTGVSESFTSFVAPGSEGNNDSKPMLGINEGR